MQELLPQAHGGAIRPPIKKGEVRNPTGRNNPDEMYVVKRLKNAGRTKKEGEQLARAYMDLLQTKNLKIRLMAFEAYFNRIGWPQELAERISSQVTINQNTLAVSWGDQPAQEPDQQGP